MADISVNQFWEAEREEMEEFGAIDEQRDGTLLDDFDEIFGATLFLGSSLICDCKWQGSTKGIFVLPATPSWFAELILVGVNGAIGNFTVTFIGDMGPVIM